MVPWDKLPKDLQKAILTMIVLYGGATASCRWGPMICDPAPPPTTAPTPTTTPTPTPMICDPPPPPTTAVPTATPTMTPMICDPAPPPSVVPQQQFQIRNVQMFSDKTLEGAAVRGTVFSAQGEPLVGLKVTARASDVQFDTWTGPDGTYFLPIPRPGFYLIMVNEDERHGLPLELRQHDLAVVEWVASGPQPQSRLPLAEIRTVNIVWKDGLTFAATSPWPGARYRWSVSGGNLSEADERVVWQPPTEPGRYLLQVVADWGQAGLAVDALTLIVEENGSVTIC